ncbi:MAG: hypothetical protein K6C94_03190 [Candidatus Gastranaerophilales bacterium]|nr:hypothetical protein [Candidatus Gastranaerophilales bacterium]
MKILKVFLCLILCLFFSANISFAKDFEVMYSVKNAKSADVKYIADFYSRQKNMYFVSAKQNHTYVNPTKNKSNYYVMIFSQNGENTDFYFYSNVDGSDIADEILKRFKSKKLKYSRIRAKKTLASKKKQALIVYNEMNPKEVNTDTKTDTAKKDDNVVYVPSPSTFVPSASQYDFSDEAQKKYDNSYSPYINTDSVTPQVQTDYTTQRGNFTDKIKINNPKGNLQGEVSQTSVNKQNTQTITQNTPEITVRIQLQSAINSQSLEQDDLISAILQDDLYINNKLMAERGSIVYGTATGTVKAGSAYRDGSITLTFNRILTTEGDEFYIGSRPMEFKSTNSSRAAKVSGAMLGSMMVGVAGAALETLIFGGNNWGQRLTMGAIVGAVGGGFVVMSANGQEMELAEGTVLNLQITGAR